MEEDHPEKKTKKIDMGEGNRLQLTQSRADSLEIFSAEVFGSAGKILVKDQRM